jgi:hypothetical protein
VQAKGRVAEWSGTGLQNLSRRFESAHDLSEFFSYGKQSLDEAVFLYGLFFLAASDKLLASSQT